MILIEKLKDIKHSYVYRKQLIKDVDTYQNSYANSAYNVVTGNFAAREILVYSHVVEKGLSHKNLKPLFGYDRVSLISEKLREYLNKGGNDPFVLGTAVSTLKKYNEINRGLGVDENKLVEIPEVSADEFDVGATSVTESAYYASTDKPFIQFSNSRHSVRLYDCTSDNVTVEEIVQCVKEAQNCPSACNRQAVRIKIIVDKDKIKRALEIQGGSRGFGENAGAVVILTSDISLYNPDERRIPMLDCGLFTMNLVYSLHAHRLGSCILNGSFTEEREQQMRQVVPIPNNEMYAVVIVISKIPKDESITIAHSCKRNVEDIVTII